MAGGPTVKPIIDYSVYDAIRAGFGKVILLFAGALKMNL
jgi:hypothetical protein